MGYPRGWSQEELIKFRRTCLLFWMLPRSGLRLRRNMSSCCCPAQRPRTHSLLTCGPGKERGGEQMTVRVSSLLVLTYGPRTSRAAGLNFGDHTTLA